MSFNWEEYYNLAKELKGRSDEASLRTAISRIYYSAYHQARVHLQQRGIVVDTSGAYSHDRIWREYLGQGVTSGAVCRYGKDLHTKRIKADYDDEIGNLKELVDDSFAIAQKVFNYLSKIKNTTIS
jgi:uncharacterized protein (UPF0332 family)